MSRRALTILGVLILVVLAGVVTYVIRGTAPWTPTGTLVILVREVPAPDTSDAVFGIGLDDVLLHPALGEAHRATVLTRRIEFDAHDGALTRLIQTGAPEGSYSGLSFQLTSPELRNDWTGDAPPEQVRLLYEQVNIPAAFTIARDTTTVIILGFETHQAIRSDTDTRIYLPVLQIETRANASVRDDVSGYTIVEDGTIVSNATYGMDWEGTVRQNVRARDRDIRDDVASGAPPDLPASEVAATIDSEATSTDGTRDAVQATTTETQPANIPEDDTSTTTEEAVKF